MAGAGILPAEYLATCVANDPGQFIVNGGDMSDQPIDIFQEALAM